MRHPFYLLLAVLQTLGCATAPRPRTIENAFHFEQSYDQIWTAVIETMAELSLPIQNLEKDSGLITTDWIGFGYSKEYCDCGSPGIAIDSERRGKFNIFVKTNTAGGVEVKINTAFEIQREFMDVRTTVPCLSTGALEARMRALISQKIGQVS